MSGGWTEAQLQTVRKMTAQGKSASEIGAAVGKSRNAVIGKILRMGGKLGRLAPKASGPKPRSRGPAKWVEGGRGRPPASVKPRLKTAVGSRQSAVDEAWDRAPAAALAMVDYRAPSTSPSPAATPLPPLGGEDGRAVVESARLPEPSRLTTDDQRPTASSNLPALLPTTFLDAVMRDRCLFFADGPLDPAGPDMPVCGAERSTRTREMRYCPRHDRAQRQAGAA